MSKKSYAMAPMMASPEFTNSCLYDEEEEDEGEYCEFSYAP
jgi:hypothetical protein